MVHYFTLHVNIKLGHFLIIVNSLSRVSAFRFVFFFFFGFIILELQSHFRPKWMLFFFCLAWKIS